LRKEANILGISAAGTPEWGFHPNSNQKGIMNILSKQINKGNPIRYASPETSIDEE
jgi:hypothetical protein